MYLDLFLHHLHFAFSGLGAPHLPWVLKNNCFTHHIPTALGGKEGIRKEVGGGEINLPP